MSVAPSILALVAATSKSSSSSDQPSTSSSTVINQDDKSKKTVSSCMECGKQFTESYLKTHFDYDVCNACRDPKDKHSLIPRTEAKNEYLLKDCDLDVREPPLKFIAKKNPNPYARNDMRLYLHVQIEERALDVWGSEEALIEEKEKRGEKRKVRQKKDFDQKMKKLRMAVRSSLYKKKNITSHVHEYGEEKHDAKSDTYEKVCRSCGHVLSYEKM